MGDLLWVMVSILMGDLLWVKVSILMGDLLWVKVSILMGDLLWVKVSILMGDLLWVKVSILMGVLQWVTVSILLGDLLWLSIDPNVVSWLVFGKVHLIDLLLLKLFHLKICPHYQLLTRPVYTDLYITLPLRPKLKSKDMASSFCVS